MVFIWVHFCCQKPVTPVAYYLQEEILGLAEDIWEVSLHKQLQCHIRACHSRILVYNVMR